MENIKELEDKQPPEPADKEWLKRYSKAKSEIDDILIKYGCTISALFHYTNQGIGASCDLFNVKPSPGHSLKKDDNPGAKK